MHDLLGENYSKPASVFGGSAGNVREKINRQRGEFAGVRRGVRAAVCGCSGVDSGVPLNFAPQKLLFSGVPRETSNSLYIIN